MSSELLIAAATAGVVHTLAGPDHYLPWIAAARAGSWSERRTLAFTGLAGLLHCGAAFAMLALGVLSFGGVAALAGAESLRGGLASWLLVAFGVALVVTAFVRPALRPRTVALTLPLQLVFVLGPCEWLLPAGAAAWAEAGFSGALATCAVFAVATLATMLGAVWLGARGLALLPAPSPRAAQVASGVITLGCGVAMTLGV